MTRTELTNKFAERLDITKKDSKVYVDELITLITETLATGEKVDINDFVKFEVVTTKPRNGVNPKTGESIVIGSKNKVKFTAKKALKDAVQ